MSVSVPLCLSVSVSLSLRRKFDFILCPRLHAPPCTIQKKHGKDKHAHPDGDDNVDDDDDDDFRQDADSAADTSAAATTKIDNASKPSAVPSEVLSSGKAVRGRGERSNMAWGL